jgi:hypothetical protein
MKMRYTWIIMSEAPLELIEDLASKEVQVRLIMDGLPDEYALPNELLDDGIRFCEQVLGSDLSTTARQREAVRALLLTIRTSKRYFDGYDRSRLAFLVESDPAWDAIRVKASGVMRVFAPLTYE